MDAAYYGFLAGATDIVFHPGSYFNAPPERVLPITIERLSECVEELRKAGTCVILRPETMGKKALIGSINDVLIISKAIDGVEPCLDFPHLFARTGDGSLNSTHDWKIILSMYREQLGEGSLKRLHVHISGIEYTAKGERKHLPIEESSFNVKALFKALSESNCGGRILCESPLLEEDALYIQQMWNNL